MHEVYTKHKAMLSVGDNRMTERQPELLKSFRHLRTGQFGNCSAFVPNAGWMRPLTKAENERGYTQEVYEGLLSEQRHKAL